MSAASPRFALGLVVGKFAPLHLGHEWLVTQAAAQCERLLILSYCQPEFARCEAAARRRWLAARWPTHEGIVIDEAELRARCTARGIACQALPDNAEPDAVQQAFLAWLLREVLGCAPDAMFCSEDYGPPCAEVLSRHLGRPVTAVVVDRARLQVPISATQIRRDPRGHRRWLAPKVAAAFVPRVALLGGESTGKTTLAAALAESLDVPWVAEYGREHWDARSGKLDADDLRCIATEQLRREALAAEAAVRRDAPLLICDTSPLTTLGYSLWMFGAEDPALQAAAQHRYDALVLCRPDFPFVQDGTRQDAAFRTRQHQWYRARLPTLATPTLEVGGPLPQRLGAVRAWLHALSLLTTAAQHAED